MVMKKIDPRKYDHDKARRLQANIEKMKTEMEQARVPMKQADGSTISVLQFDYVVAYQKAVENFRKWFQSCLVE